MHVLRGPLAGFLPLLAVSLLGPAASGAEDDLAALAALAPERPGMFGVVLERGWNDPAERALGSEAAISELGHLALRGATAVGLDVIGLVAAADSPFIAAAATDSGRERAAFGAMVDAAHAHGLRVVVRARIDLQSGGDAASLGARDERGWPKWFAEHRRFVLDVAQLAASVDADALVLGLGLSGTTQREAEWRETIRQVRRVYPGTLTYGARSGDELERIRFWDDLDLVGVELYPALERAGDRDPSPRPRPSVWSAADEDSVAVHELARALAPHGARMARMAARAARPVMITGVGFRSIENAWSDPSAPLARNASSSERDQRRAVAAVNRAIGAAPWLRGALWFEWSLPIAQDDAARRRAWARNFSLQDKSAAEELRRGWAAVPLGWATARPIGRGGVVVSSDSTATGVGLEVLREGGNAADAAIATAFALAVTLPEAGNLGGGGFLVSFDPRRREARTLDFRERAPLRAHERTYVELAEQGIPTASTRGPLATGIPGTVAGLHALWEAEGSLPWERLLRPAFELAAHGFTVGEATARTFAAERALLNTYTTTRELFVPQGRTPREGELFVQSDLAGVLLTLMREGPGAFYRGAIARKLVDAVDEAGGLWTLEDLSSYRAQWRRAVRWPLTRDGRVELITMGAPSSAGALLPQLWTFMESQGADRLAPSGADRAQAWVEAMRLAFADRNTHLGDPDRMRIDERALIAPSYLRERARRLPPRGVAGRSADVDAGDPDPRARRRGGSDETTHLVVIDAQGRAISLTTTLNGLFGSGWIAPGTGILLNNQMDDFDTRPGEPNLYGLVGAGENRVHGGARMLSSMTPCIVTRDGRTWLVLGGRGGPRIATAVAQILYHRVIDGWPLDRAVAAPRLHHQWWPDDVQFETGRAWPGLAAALQVMGYTVESQAKAGKVHAAEALGDGRFVGVADPRERGLARCVDPERRSDGERVNDPGRRRAP